MADSERLPKLIELTAQHESKLVLAGDSAQLSSIGAGGLFKEIEKNVHAAELKEVHRARDEWEKRAWVEVRNGEAMRALARYEAHERLHIHDTRREAAQAMVAKWDRERIQAGPGKAVMITDASNKERDQINAMAQEHRARAGELGSHLIALPGKPYGLRAGDEIIFTAQHHPPGQERVENGIIGTITDTDREADGVTIKTRETPEREVRLDTKEFSGLSLAYAVHVYKAQGLTTERASVLIGGWQTDRESAYVSVSRAREQTDIHVSREDLGEQGMDPGAIERLADRIEQTHAQEASIARDNAPLAHDRTAERDDGLEQQSEQSHEKDRDRDQEIEREAEQDRDRDRDIDRALGIE
jgi:ATP-dependent exoDNAse (exonuclease V) alpha subunit